MQGVGSNPHAVDNEAEAFCSFPIRQRLQHSKTGHLQRPVEEQNPTAKASVSLAINWSLRRMLEQQYGCDNGKLTQGTHSGDEELGQNPEMERGQNKWDTMPYNVKSKRGGVKKDAWVLGRVNSDLQVAGLALSKKEALLLLQQEGGRKFDHGCTGADFVGTQKGSHIQC